MTVYLRPKKIDKLSREEKIGLMLDLVNAFRMVSQPVETALLLQDLLTANEIRNLAIRLRIAKLLLAGKSHREIIQETHTSFATVTKVNLWLQQGGEGLKKVVSNLPLRHKMPERLPPGPIEFHLPQLLLALGQYTLAKKQERGVEKFIEGVGDKEIMDESFQEAVDEYYRSKVGKKK